MADDKIVVRPMARMTTGSGTELLLVSCFPGDKIFDAIGDFLGIVMNGVPVVNDHTVYLSTDDYRAAKVAAQGNQTAYSIVRH